MATRRTWGGEREGAGRPSSFRHPVDRFIRFERADVKAAEALARKRGVSFAEIVRLALHQYVERERRRAR
jgi:hypothetical protein